MLRFICGEKIFLIKRQKCMIMFYFSASYNGELGLSRVQEGQKSMKKSIFFSSFFDFLTLPFALKSYSELLNSPTT